MDSKDPHDRQKSVRFPFSDDTNKSSESSTGRKELTLKGTRRPVHAPIPQPSYPVRSQPVNLARSRSFTEQSIAPTISGGLARRLSIGSSSDEGQSQDEADPNDSRKLFTRRSDSLPKFPPSDKQQQIDSTHDVITKELAELPPNPKLWLPSHLSLYLSAHLQLHPVVASDVVSFIRQSKLSGRTFLRLRDADLEEMGINVVWRPALSAARDILKAEAAGGRAIWGFEGGRIDTDDGSLARSSTSSGTKQPTLRRRGSMEVEGSDLEEEAGKEEWKRSWRRMQGTSRVRGMVGRLDSAIIEGSRETTPAGSPMKQRVALPKSPFPKDVPHERTSSATSSGSTGDDGTVSPLAEQHVFVHSSDQYQHTPCYSNCHDDDFALPPPFQLCKSYFSPDTPDEFTTSVDSSSPFTPDSSYQGNIRAHSRPYSLVRRPSQQARESSTLRTQRLPELLGDETDAGELTVKPGGNTAMRDEQRGGLAELFDLGSPRSEGMAPTIDRDIVEVDIHGLGGQRGSMILVKRSQLAALSKRMAEVEAQVALAQGIVSTTASDDTRAEGMLLLETRLNSIEEMLTLPASSRRESTTSSTHSLSSEDRPTHSELLSLWFQHSLSSLSLRDIATHSHDSARQLMDADGPLMSWTALGGYCIAASIGIGIVAGEVIAARLFGIRRR